MPIYAVHGANSLDYDGWVVLTREVGRNPDEHGGEDFRHFRQTPIVRLNHGYGHAGTIPQPQHYGAFAQRVANFVAGSQGCTRWIIGNEMNHSNERPDGKPVTPTDYARCYNLCRSAIKGLLNHRDHEVLIGAIAPWNNQTTYDGNPAGDWIRYFEDVQRAVAGCDGFALHTYARAQDPQAIWTHDRMKPPFEHYHNGFQTYTDWMHAIRDEYQGLPCYITEFDCLEPWRDANTGVVRQAYQDVHAWNERYPGKPIHCLAVYRWQYDRWTFKDKPGVIADFYEAVRCGYTVPPMTGELPEPEPPEEAETWRFVIRVEGTSSRGRLRTWEGELREVG